MADNSEPNLINEIAGMIDAKLAATHVSMPARILTYDESEQRATVQPIVRRYYTNEEDARIAERLPAIEGVPVAFPGAGEYGITFPLSAGDTVLLVFGECSLDKWLAYGGSDVDPDDPRRNAISDAVAYAGLRPFSNPSTQVDDSAMVVAGIMLKLGDKDASKIPATVAELQAVISWVAAHTHLYAPGPGTAIATPVRTNVAAAPTPVGASKVRMT